MIGPVRRWVVWLALSGGIAGAVWLGYTLGRAPLFEYFAAGSRWVLVACGFETPGTPQSAGAERLRRLYYAARMFREVPPVRLSEQDAWANAHYPGMGFGLLRTFEQTPVRVVVAGWRYLIPCAYFADARNCQAGASGSARLRMLVEDFGPLRPAFVADFLAANSPRVMRLTLAASDRRPAQWWLEDLPPGGQFPESDLEGFAAYRSHDSGYQVYRPLTGDDGTVQLHCNPADARARHGVWHHCRDRFTVGAGALVELHYAGTHAPRWRHLREGVRRRLGEFRGDVPLAPVVSPPSASG